MNLFKRIINIVDGYEGNVTTFESYFLSDFQEIPNDRPLTQEDVVNNEEVFSIYYGYENLGVISDDEINILKKLGII